MIKVSGLTKRYGGTTAVGGLSFVVRPGRVTGFLGPNGAGKSTTMRMLLSLDAPTSGEVLVKDLPYRSFQRPLHEVGALLDANAVHGGRRALDHLLCIARSNGIGRSRVREVAELAGIDQVARKRVGGFSLGMRQRLGIAAALLGDPEVLIFDEPLNGLDTDGIRWVRGLLKGLAAEGRTVFFSSHLMSEMALTADHLLVIGHGRLVADVGTAEFVRSSSLGDVLVRSADDAALERLLGMGAAVVAAEPGGGLAVSGVDASVIGRLAAEHDIAVYELATRHASLEEAYLELTDGSVDYRAAGHAHHLRHPREDSRP